jgi:hypothetical protein
MGSCEPLGTPAHAPSSEDANTEESDTVIIDGTSNPVDALEKVAAGKRKRGALTEMRSCMAFTNMTEVIKHVT